MADTFGGQLYPPRSDAWIERNGVPEAPVLVPSTSTATADPRDGGGVTYMDTAEAETVRGFVAVTGTVTALTLAVHTLQDGAWYWHSDYTFTDLAGNTSFAIELLGKYTSFHIQVESITGGGSVEVRVLGIWT